MESDPIYTDILNLDLLPFIIHFLNHSFLKIFTFIIIIVIYMYLFFYNHWLVWLMSHFMSQFVEVWRVRHSSHLYHDRRKRFFASMIDFDSWNDNFETTGRKSVNRSRLILIFFNRFIEWVMLSSVNIQFIRVKAFFLFGEKIDNTDVVISFVNQRFGILTHGS